MAGRGRRAARILGWVVGVTLAGGVDRVAAQGSVTLVDDSTTVHALGFEFDAPPGITQSQLLLAMATRGTTLGRKVQGALSWLPLVGRPEPLLFDPITLQEDVARLRLFLVESGFPEPAVDYRVDYDPDRDRIDITMVVDPGAPRLLSSIALEIDDTPPLLVLEPDGLQEALREGWEGRRVGLDELQQIQQRALQWARARGFAFVRVETTLDDRGDPFTGDVAVRLTAGPVTTLGRIVITGEPRLDSAVIRRHLGLRSGDTLTSRRIDRGVQQLQQLDLVNAALVGVPDSVAPTATPDLSVRLLESPPRIVSGRAGYADAEGVLAEGRLEHRDFLGGARVLRASTTVTTGIWSFEDYPLKHYGGSLSLTEPYLFTPRLDLVPTVFGFYEDGPREEAFTFGGELSIVYQKGPNRFLSLGYSVTRKDVREFRGIGISSLSTLEILNLLEDLEGTSLRTALTLSGSWGFRDDLTNPTRGWVVTGSADLAGPDPWADTQYLRGDFSASLLRPFLGGRIRFLARGRVGRVQPFGRSGVDGGDPLRAYLQLGDAVFSEGGTGTVRGWKSGLLGPKFPDLRIDLDSARIVPNGRWVPLGGLSRWGGSLEAQVPLPLLGGAPYALAFVDGARVWTPDTWYTSEDGLPLDVDDQAFFSVGGGLALPTPVGAVRLMVGYKLNPSALELRNPDRVLEDVLLGGADLASVPENAWRRWRIHLAIGQPF